MIHNLNFNRSIIIVTLSYWPASVSVSVIARLAIINSSLRGALLSHSFIPSFLVNYFPLITYLQSKLNCEVLYDPLGFELRWVMDGDDIVMQLVGQISKGDYMSFGLAKDDSRSNMIGADAVVVWYDNQGHAVDYFLESKQQVSKPNLA